MKDEKSKPSMERMLTEMAEMMKKIEDYKGPLPTTPEALGPLVGDIEMLKHFMDTIEDFVIAPIEAKVDLDALTQETLENPKISTNHKQIIKQSLEVDQEAKILKAAFKKVMDKNKSRGKTKAGGKDAASQQLIKERRKLFKTIGGDKKWIPM